MSIVMGAAQAPGPFGSLLYGWLFQVFLSREYMTAVIAIVITGALGLTAKKTLQKGAPAGY